MPITDSTTQKPLKPLCQQVIRDLEEIAWHLRSAAEELTKPKEGAFFTRIADAYDQLIEPVLGLMGLEDFDFGVRLVRDDILDIRKFVEFEFMTVAHWERRWSMAEGIYMLIEIADDLLAIATYTEEQCRSGKWPDWKFPSSGHWSHRVTAWIPAFLDPMKA